MKSRLVLILAILMIATPSMAVDVTFSPRITLRGEYTDNFYRSRDDKIDEYITTIAPGAMLRLKGSTAELTLSYDPTYVTYSDTDEIGMDEDPDWRHYGSLKGHWNISRRTRFNMANSLVISEDPADDEEALDVMQGRNRYTRYSGDLGFTHQFGREDTCGAGYSYSVLRYEEAYSEDSELQKPYFNLTKWFGDSRYGMTTHIDYSMAHFEVDDDAAIEPSDDFTSVYSYLRLMRRMNRNLDLFTQYTHTVTTYDGASEDYSVYNPSIGFIYQIEEQTTITMSLGYLIRDREESEDDNEISLTGDVTSIWSFPRGTFKLTAESGYRQDSFDSDNLGFNYYGGGEGSLKYNFTRTFQGDIFGGYQYQRFLDTDPEITDNTANAGAGMTYKALPWMTLRLEYRYHTVSSTEDSREFDENRIWLSVTFSPEKPYRLN